MRQSSDLLRFFLFCTACRLCFTEIIPHKELRKMEKIVETRNLSKGLYQRMETKQLASSFKCLFEHLRDEQASISITGHENGVWIDWSN